MNCYYCDKIASKEPAYEPRAAEFDTGSEAPRCAWHWRFVCDHCHEPGHFMSRFHCPQSSRILCAEAGRTQTWTGDFWAWQYWWYLTCPDCGERHPSMDYAEFEGKHPWQLNSAAALQKRNLSPETRLTRYPAQDGWVRGAPGELVGRLPRVALDSITDVGSDINWSGNAEVWDSRYDERGDNNRKYQSDPVLLDFLGDVGGQRVLDAGCGAGYLSRLLAKRGASMIGVENSTGFYEKAMAYQAAEPLEIELHHASISDMSFLADDSVDAAVANYVLHDVRDYESAIAEIARVLKPGGGGGLSW